MMTGMCAMIDSLTASLSWRFMRSRRGGTLSHFMSIASTAGIAIGVAALIIGLSAMNGFERELHERVLSLVPSVTVTSDADGFYELNHDLAIIDKISGIDEVDPGLMINIVLKAGNAFAPTQLIGVHQQGQLDKNLERFTSTGLDIAGIDETPRIIIGSGIARKLKLEVGSKVTIVTGDNIENAEGNEVEVSGFFKAGGQMDNLLSFMNLSDAIKLTRRNAPNVLMIRTTDLMQAPRISHEIAGKLPERSKASSWLSTQGKLYNDIQMVRGIMYLAMILVMAVACFNIISNLVMAVAEKSREIAVLKTIGASNSRIITVFTLSGLLSGMRGALIGSFFGISISLFLTPIMRTIESLTNFKFLNPDVYFIDFIPSRLDITDVLLVVVTALIMSALSSLYPAWKASKIEPAKELNL